MVISFEEKDRAIIEAKGMTIIEFKRNLYKIAQNVSGAWKIIKDAIDKIIKVWEEAKKCVSESFDRVKFFVTEIFEAYNYPAYPTMRRYRVVKVLSKCTGIEKLELWKITRHTWLARSCC